MAKKKFDTDQAIIDALKELPTDSNASMFIHTIKDGEKNYISYFLEANVDDLASMLHQLFNESGFKTAVYRALLTHFQFDPEEKLLFRKVLDTIDKIDLANMN